MNDITALPLTVVEIRESIDRINEYVDSIGRELLMLQEAEAWRVLGYQSWTKFLEGEFTYSRKHLYGLMRAFPVTERLQEAGYQIAPTHALELAKLPADVQVIAYQIAEKRPGGATTDRIKAIGSVLTEAAQSGLVTAPEGYQVAFEAAYKAERREQEITHKATANILDTTADIMRRFGQDDGDYIVMRVPRGMAANITTMRNVRFVLKTLEAA